MSETVKLEITDCSKCPFLETPRHYTSDSFEVVFDWKCAKSHRAIISVMDWNDPAPAIPQWCPLRAKI